MSINTTLWLYFFAVVPALAQTPQLAFPVDCTLGTDCWTVNYVDTDPAVGQYSDFTCGRKTYDDHKGTDFGLRSRYDMERGVDVLAALDGKVLRLRDGEDDTIKTESEYQAIRAENKDCGNGVIIDHGQGLQTFYCHLKQGSIKVAVGDEVAQGQPIAQVGQSGFSEFPHLHFSVIWEGGHVDPYTSHTMADGCGLFKANLWANDLAYEPLSVFDGGFTTTRPDFVVIQRGMPVVSNLPPDGENFVYWAAFYHAREGDQVEMRITMPDGRIFSRREFTITENRKRPSYYYTGRALRGRTLPAGTYEGSITLTREGLPPHTVEHHVVVD